MITNPLEWFQPIAQDAPEALYGFFEGAANAVKQLQDRVRRGEPFMKMLREIIVNAALCASIVAGAGTTYAAPPAPQQPRIFTPSCAAPPRCADRICLRMGRCSLGSHTQPMGCLIYSCRHGAQ